MHLKCSRPIVLAIVAALCMLTIGVSASTPRETKALLDAYYTYLLFENTVAHTMDLDKNLSDQDKQQIQTSNQQWQKYSMKKLRKKLSKKIENNPKQAFGVFVAQYTKAEENGDTEYLDTLAQATGISPTPSSYTAFNQAYAAEALDPQINYCARYISEVQTWLDVKQKHADAPTLSQWLSKDSNTKTKAKKKAPKKKKLTGLAALAAAEAPLPDYEPEDDEDMTNPMDAFSEMRSERREKAMEQAQAGMAQVAAEREAAEAAYAEKKATAAQAEADAVAAQARKLATAEEDALSQRQNSWSARFKRLLSGTISGAVGAFTGGVGAEAGVRAANAVFNNDK